MTQPPEHEEKNTAPDSSRKSDSRPADDGRAAKDSKAAKDSPASSKISVLPLKLKLIADYAMRGSPVLAVLALIFAVVAVVSNLSSQAQLSMTSSKLESVNASLSASKVELEKLKATITQDKTMQEEERKKQNEVVSEIIRNVTNLQIKMKVYPTLEEQLVQPTSTSRQP